MKTSSKTRRVASVVTTPPPTEPTPSVAAGRKTLPLVVTLSLLLVAALSAAGYFYYQYRHSAQVADAKEIEELTENIGRFFLLPDGETPTLATVTDKEKLAEQPFFQKAENGDKVLIYSASGRAILYRPSSEKIIDVTSVNINTPETTPSVATETTSQKVLGESETSPIETVVNVALYNGSTQVGVTNSLEARITAGLPGVVVTKKESAAKNDYEESIVVDVTGTHGALVEQLAQLIGGKVGPKPSGEADPGTDVLVIVGNKSE